MNHQIKKLVSFTIILASASNLFAQVSIIPQPAEVVVPENGGSFQLTQQTKIIAPGAAQNRSIAFLNKYLKQFYGFGLKTGGKKDVTNSVVVEVQKSTGLPPGSYMLQVKNNGVRITGSDDAGVFYGVQTLLQLLPPEQKPSLSIPLVQVVDSPRFSYRGMHLDASRHFFPVDFIKQYIDFLALHKMNFFHWHLTDDQGWRIEIKKYPKLTSTGGYRDGTIIGHYPGTGNDNQRYGGSYTQDEVRDVVRYAASRYITVIPEIEMPGHSSAAIAAYPWLSCFPAEETKIPAHPSDASQQKDGKKVQETWGVFEDIYCAGKDSTFLFLQDVLDEVLALFPSKYIHVGGDEAPKDHWKICPNCQARIRAEHLKNEHELQSYFIQRIENYLNQKGRTLIGWDEILEGGLAPNAVVMSWRGEDGGIEAARQNHDVIMTPGSHVYFDHSQTRNDDSLTIGGLTTLQKVYSYEPVPAQLNATEATHILGAQANVWTEYITNTGKVEYMIFPRMSALSEVLWSPKDKRNWNSFEHRLQQQFQRYALWKVQYSKAVAENDSENKEGK